MAFIKGAKGFTLIELLICIAIIGILAAICYPSYQQYVLRSYRTQAITHLMQLANSQEQYLADYGTYAQDLNAMNFDDAGLRYRFSLVLSGNGHGYLLTAEAQASQRGDSDCLVYSLNQAGQRNTAQPYSLLCWE